MLPTTKLTAALIVTAILTASPAWAKTVKDFEAMPREQRSEYVVSFLEKMTYDIGQKNPKLAQDIEDYFVKIQPGKEFPEGAEKVYVELAALESLATEGKVDLSKIQVEGVIVKIIKEKFPPPQRQEAAK